MSQLGLGASLEHPLDGRNIDTVGLELDLPHVGAAVAQREQRAIVGRALDEHRIAGLDQGVEQERVRLHRAVGDEHLLGIDLMLFGDPFPQRHVSDGCSVGRCAGGILGEGLFGRGP